VRPPCIHCTIKHLGQAYANHLEVHTGYPDHLMAVIGHLAEAAEECLALSPELAMEIREARLSVLEKVDSIYLDGADVNVPYFELFRKAVMVLREKGCGNCQSASERLRKMIKERKDGEHGKD
jgi:hypothetical protein